MILSTLVLYTALMRWIQCFFYSNTCTSVNYLRTDLCKYTVVELLMQTQYILHALICQYRNSFQRGENECTNFGLMNTWGPHQKFSWPETS